MHSSTALTAFLRDALDGDVADGMKVVAGSGMNVTVQAGTARVGRDPSYDINVTGTESVDVGAASPSNPMNAVIVAYVDRGVAGSTSVTDNTNDVFKLKAVSGAAAPSPSDPSSSAIQSAIGAANPYIILARVRKRAGATSVITSDITDMRVMVTLKPGRVGSNHLSDGIILPRHLSRTDWPAFRADAASSQNFANNTFTKVEFTAESYDTMDNFADSVFTAPVNGIYHFDAAIAFSAGSGVRTIARFVAAGDNNIRFIEHVSSGNGTNSTGSLDVMLNAGDTVYIEAWKSSGTLSFGNSRSMFSGRLVRQLS